MCGEESYSPVDKAECVCMPYKDVILILAQVFAIIAIFFSFAGVLSILLGFVAVIILSVAFCCRMNKCGLVTAGVFASIAAAGCLLVAILLFSEISDIDCYGADGDGSDVYCVFDLNANLYCQEGKIPGRLCLWDSDAEAHYCGIYYSDDDFLGGDDDGVNLKTMDRCTYTERDGLDCPNIDTDGECNYNAWGAVALVGGLLWTVSAVLTFIFACCRLGKYREQANSGDPVNIPVATANTVDVKAVDADPNATTNFVTPVPAAMASPPASGTTVQRVSYLPDGSKKIETETTDAQGNKVVKTVIEKAVEEEEIEVNRV
eukprot:CAMPEP_0119550134 /NCGR_PEP_ID=MMETSP1352-20130426/3713_1 /TAXON_ID=265584 /ORGANISM="Stauroneis constricta, Strain CCMP1120" /LENGTH=317 /DNA_ID=CAMNT_0007595891 /DNA_START=66 /DNA_END=1019 /DNA_ORIENTATION=+